MITYTVKKLADISRVSVRTLHHYDKIGLLKPHRRTESGYRLYGEDELFRLQQILFYKELDLSLSEIGMILDAPAFNREKALNVHKDALIAQREHIGVLLKTIDRTLEHLNKGDLFMRPEDLYEGLDKKTIDTYREKARDMFGKDKVEQSENALKNMGMDKFHALKNEMEICRKALFDLKDQDPASLEVQELTAQYYQIIRRFWGTAKDPDPQKLAFKGLGELYTQDERYTVMNGETQKEFGEFLRKAMSIFSENL